MIQLYSTCSDGLKPPPGILLTVTCYAEHRHFLNVETEGRRQWKIDCLEKGGPTEGADVHLIHNKYYPPGN